MGYDNETTEEAVTAKFLGLQIDTNFGVGRSAMMMMKKKKTTMLMTYYPTLYLACLSLSVVISLVTTDT
jgi:hypothetical protein